MTNVTTCDIDKIPEDLAQCVVMCKLGGNHTIKARVKVKKTVYERGVPRTIEKTRYYEVSSVGKDQVTFKTGWLRNVRHFSVNFDKLFGYYFYIPEKKST